MQLTDMVHEGITMLHCFGFTVMKTVCDGATENRKFQTITFQPDLIGHFLHSGYYSREHALFIMQNPADPSFPVMNGSDIVHVFKKWRNQVSGHDVQTAALE
jgi:hypothetical protein